MINFDGEARHGQAGATSVGICTGQFDLETGLSTEQPELEAPTQNIGLPPTGNFTVIYDRFAVPKFTGCTELVGNMCGLYERECGIKANSDRVQEVLSGSRENDSPPNVVTINTPRFALTLYRDRAVVKRSDREGEINLTSSQFKIMDMLARNPRGILSTDQISQELDPGYVRAGGRGNVYPHIRDIRNKIDGHDVPYTQSFLQLKRGLGYTIPLSKR